MQRLGLSCLSIVLLIASGRIAVAKADPPKAPVSREAALAPELRGLEWISSDSLSIESSRGRILVLLFWNSSFQEFHPYLPGLDAMAREMREKGVRFAGISAEPRAQLEANAAKLGISFPLAIDNLIACFSHYEAKQIPHAAIVDPRGKIAWTGQPYAQNGFAEALSGVVREHAALLSFRSEFDRAAELRGAGKTAEALRALLKLVSAMPPDGKLGELAVATLRVIETEATEALIEAHQLHADRGILSAIEKLDTIARTYPGSSAAGIAQEEAKHLRKAPKFEMETQARKLFDAAKEQQKKGNRARSKELFEKVIASFPDTESSRDAIAMVRGESTLP